MTSNSISSSFDSLWPNFFSIDIGSMFIVVPLSVAYLLLQHYLPILCPPCICQSLPPHAGDWDGSRIPWWALTMANDTREPWFSDQLAPNLVLLELDASVSSAANNLHEGPTSIMPRSSDWSWSYDVLTISGSVKTILSSDAKLCKVENPGGRSSSSLARLGLLLFECLHPNCLTKLLSFSRPS